MKRIASAIVISLLFSLFSVTSYSGDIEKSPVRQFQRTETVEQSAVPAEQQPSHDDFVMEYHRVQNYQASFLAETVRLMLSPDGIIQANDDLNLIIIPDEPDRVEKIVEMLDEVDTLPRQIVIHAKVLEISNNYEKDTGMSFSTLLENSSLNYTISKSNNESKEESEYDRYKIVDDSNWPKPDVDLTESTTQNVDQENSLRKSGMFKINYPHLSELVNFLVTKGYAKVLAEPKIVTINNKPGRFFIGDRVNLVDYEVYPGFIQKASIQEEAGLLLEVVPHIGESDFITIDIKTEFGTLDILTNTTIQTNTREAKSTIIVRNGEPLVLGGYNIRQEGNTRYETPIIGKIPLLKKLFSKKIKYSDEIEMVIIMLPEIVEPGHGIKSKIGLDPDVPAGEKLE